MLLGIHHGVLNLLVVDTSDAADRDIKSAMRICITESHCIICIVLWNSLLLRLAGVELSDHGTASTRASSNMVCIQSMGL